MRISDWSSDVCSSDLAVHIGQRLEVGLVFAELLGAAVKEADVRVDALNDLAVELEDEAQHAVRGGVLRAEVDRVVGDFEIGRESCRERVCQYVSISLVAYS